MKWLLIAALAPVLGFAQENPAPQPSVTQRLTTQLNASKTLDEVVALEKEMAANLAVLSPTEKDVLSRLLYQAYRNCIARKQVVSGRWICDVFPKYIPGWETATGNGVHAFYNEWVAKPALTQLWASLDKVKNPAEFDAAVAGFFSTNLLPARLQEKWDSRAARPFVCLPKISEAASRIGHPEALNYALLAYRLIGMDSEEGINIATAAVASALKSKDSNLARANAWIEGQNTGSPTVTFTEQEMARPSAAIPASLQVGTLQDAKEKYRSAKTQAALDLGIYAVANALKAQDLNLARANAWIKAQKDGTPFELP